MNSAYIDMATEAHPLSNAQIDDANQRRGSTTSQDAIVDNHQPGVSPPLGPGREEQLDLEGNPVSILNMPAAARLAPSPSPKGVDVALQVDTTHIPSAGPVPDPRLSPDGMSIGNSYAWLTPATEEADPLLLRSRVVDADHELRRRPSHNRRTNKKVKKYYERQNELIENLLKPIAKHASDGEDDAEQAGAMVRCYRFILSPFNMLTLIFIIR